MGESKHKQQHASIVYIFNALAIKRILTLFNTILQVRHNRQFNSVKTIVLPAD